MKILQRSKVKEYINYERMFSYTPDRFTSGFGFPCDKEGNIELDGIAKENYNKCLTGEINGEKIYDMGVMDFHHTHKEPAIGLCDCGCEVSLGGFTNTCECGADYNWNGQRLAPRECWGEETGEHWTECY